ncbi:MAG: DUF4136 domain-containing protein [Acidobacteria bacterium]|nr:DUF4136 domain-containing protein [Acidobacteriota bacterium]
MLLRVRLAFCLAACSTLLSAQDVKVHWDRTAFFSNYKTYRWIEVPGSRHVHPNMVKEIVAQADGQLKARGLKLAAKDPVDLLVAYQTTVEGDIPSTAPGAPYQPGPAWNSKVSSLPKGTLALNLYDAKSKALVWRALIAAEVGESRPSDKSKVAKGLSKAFTQYPPMGN